MPSLRRLIAPIARPVRDRGEVLVDRLRGVRRDGTGDLRSVFEGIHARGSWGGASVSGPGSDDVDTAVVRSELPELLAGLGVRSLVDAPCGDANWITRLDYPLERYVGIDIVEQVVRHAETRHAGPGRSFQVGDICADPLPAADAVLCRDCLVHLPLAAGVAALANIRASGATWLIATTFPEHRSNPEIRPGRWRPLNLALAPFSLGVPERLVSERFARDPRYADKALGVWRLVP